MKFDQRVIQAQCSVATSLECFDTIDSTNTYLLSKARGELQSGYAVVADQQTAGRGRRGREWISLPGSQLYCSMLWIFPSTCSLSGLSLTIGVALVRALERMGIHGVQLKWPNDLFFNHCKLGGILIESFMDPQGCCRAVIGMGLNLASSDTLSSSISQSAIALEEITLKKINRDVLLGIILDELLMILPEFQTYGFERFLQEWLVLDILVSQIVQIETSNGVDVGIAQGVDINGILQVKVNEKIKNYSAGDVSVHLNGHKSAL